MLVINHRVAIPKSEFKFTFARSGGPGGQNVNKVNSKATMHWNVTQSPSLPDDIRQRFIAKFKNRITRDGELVLSSQEFRDQPKNTAACLEKLEQMIRQVLVPQKKRRPTKPTRGSRERRLESKRRSSEKKQTRRSSRDLHG